MPFKAQTNSTDTTIPQRTLKELPEEIIHAAELYVKHEAQAPNMLKAAELAAKELSVEEAEGIARYFLNYELVKEENVPLFVSGCDYIMSSSKFLGDKRKFAKTPESVDVYNVLAVTLRVLCQYFDTNTELDDYIISGRKKSNVDDVYLAIRDNNKPNRNKFSFKYL